MIFCIGAVEALGSLTPEAFGATNRQAVTISICNTLLKAREANSHHCIHSGVRGRHNGRSIDNGRTKLCDRSCATGAQEIRIGVSEPYAGRFRRFPLSTEAGNRFVRCGHIGIRRIRCGICVVPVDGSIHHGQTHSKVVSEAAADVAFEVLAIVGLKTCRHTAR